MPDLRGIKVEPQYLDSIRNAWQNRRLILFLGAGVSLPYGIPAWRDLALGLLLNKTSGTFVQLGNHYRQALSDWLADNFDFAPTTLARVIKYRDDKTSGGRDFREDLRLTLYRNWRENPTSQATLPQIADFIQKSEKSGNSLPAVLTFNFDDLLERELQHRGIDFQTIATQQQRCASILPVIHVHGYLPREGDLQNAEIVFSEEDYHRLTFSVFHWATSEIVHYLRNYTVLFIGMSMSDPNLRRLLDATCVEGSIRHFLIRKDYTLSQQEIADATDDIKERVKERAKDKTKLVGAEQTIRETVEVVLSEANSFDRKLMEDMGVGTIWVKNYADIARVIAAIPGD